MATILETYELLVYGDIHYFANSLKEKCAKSSDTVACFFLFFLLLFIVPCIIDQYY
jgi:hypothetical protein